MSDQKEYHLEDGALLIQGEAIEVLKTIEDNSIDSIVTDPPYGLSNTKPNQVADVLKEWVTGDTEAVPAKRGGFMGKDWDSFVPPPAVWEECLRVLKPGGHMAVFAGSRTQDLMGLSIRLAGFEIRDTLGWIYGSGFPKSMDVAKAIDRAAGAEREVTRHETRELVPGDTISFNQRSSNERERRDIPATPEAAKWDGWGTSLKPAIEPIILARKPLEGTVANNVLTHGVGGLNIDANRVGTEARVNPSAGNKAGGASLNLSVTGMPENVQGREVAGRFPANVLLDEHAATEMDEQSGIAKPKRARTGKRGGSSWHGRESIGSPDKCGHWPEDAGGGASRFFPVFKYQAKAPKKERPVIENDDGAKIQHPTVKPLELMKWLVRLITPTGGTVLDPFTGSGATLEAAKDEGFDPIGIEREKEYVLLIEERFRNRRDRLEDSES